MDEKDKTGTADEEPKARRIELSFAQVAGSALAAVIAAVFAGKMGVYGTFLGAGVVSVVATTGGPIFQHFFRRTGEQIKDKTPVPPLVRQITVRERDGDREATTVMTVEDPGPYKDESEPVKEPLAPPGPPPDPGQAPGPDPGPGSDADPERTRLLRTDLGRTGHGATAGQGAEGAPVDDPTRQLRLGADRTQLLRTADVTRLTAAAPEAGEGTAETEAEPEEYTYATTHGTRWRGWKRTMLPAVLVFVLAIGGITLYELLSGGSVSGGKGTSISHVFGSGGSSDGDGDDGTTPTPGPSSSTGSGDDGSSTTDGDGTDPGTGSPSPDTGTGDGTSTTQEPTPTPSETTKGSGSDGTDGDTGRTTDPDTGTSGDTDQSTGDADGQSGTGSGSGSGQQSEPSTG
ncbi:hypothetical protein [Streptomyces daliensis]